MAEIDWLEQIERLYSLEKESTSLLTRAVVGARGKNYSWGDIAKAMGISRQGASQRFRGKVA